MNTFYRLVIEDAEGKVVYENDFESVANAMDELEDWDLEVCVYNIECLECQT